MYAFTTLRTTKRNLLVCKLLSSLLSTAPLTTESDVDGTQIPTCTCICSSTKASQWRTYCTEWPVTKVNSLIIVIQLSLSLLLQPQLFRHHLQTRQRSQPYSYWHHIIHNTPHDMMFTKWLFMLSVEDMHEPHVQIVYMYVHVQYM